MEKINKIFALLGTSSCRLSDVDKSLSDYVVYLSSREQRLKGGEVVCVHKTASSDIILLKQAKDFIFR